MSPKRRLVIYVVSYEFFAVLLTTVGLLVLGFSGGGSGTIAILSSSIALVWNYVWSSMFEAWERRQISQKRTVLRRIIHAVGFESGLILALVPIMAWVLGVSLLQAFILDLGLLLFFLLYTFVFAWLFDLLLPSVQPRNDQG